MLGYIPRKPPHGLASSVIAGSCDPQFLSLLRGCKLLIPATEPRGSITPLGIRQGATSIPFVAGTAGSVEMGAAQFGPCIRSSFIDSNFLGTHMRWSVSRLDVDLFPVDEWTVALFSEFDTSTVQNRVVRWFELNNLVFDFDNDQVNPRLIVRFPLLNISFSVDVFSLARWADGATVVFTYKNKECRCFIDGHLLGLVAGLNDPNWTTPGEFQFNDNTQREKFQWNGASYLTLVSDRQWNEGDIQLFTNNPFGVLWPAVAFRKQLFVIPEIVGFVQGMADARAAVFVSSRADSAVSGKADVRPAVRGTGKAG